MLRPAELTNLRGHEHVSLFTTFAYHDSDDGTWRVQLRGAVYEPETVSLQKRLLMRVLKRFIDASPDELDSEVFRDRIRFFVAGTEKGRRVAIRVGDEVVRVQKKSKRNGHFRGTVRLDGPRVADLSESGHISGDWLTVELHRPEDQGPQVSGKIRLIPPRGVSVISDIDDTIKHSDVTCRRKLLANTFLHPFRSIEGMADLYRSWASGGAIFHYVSSSPWQLYEPLSELCDRHDFPLGTFHLRAFRLRDHMLRRLLLIRRPGKSATIRQLIARFPDRRFVLIGDSGERDADIYGAVARKFPEQVRAIYIRQLDERPLDEMRIRRAFHGLPPESWHLFRESQELPRSLH